MARWCAFVTIASFWLVLAQVPAIWGKIRAEREPAGKAVPIQEFTTLYGTNQEAFDEKYKGKDVVQEGIVGGITHPDPVTKKVYAMLPGFHKAGEAVSFSARCVYDPSFDDMRIGHKVQIKGTCQGYSKTSYSAELKNCKLVMVLDDDYPPSAKVKAVIKGLQGKWKVVKAEADGKERDAKMIGFEELIFENYRLEFRGGNRLVVWGAAPVADKETKAIDLHNGRGVRLPCAYALNGKALRLAIPASNPQGIERPASFDSSKSRMLVLTAEKGEDGEKKK